jgi:hypothetical protein
MTALYAKEDTHAPPLIVALVNGPPIKSVEEKLAWGPVE